MHKLSLSALQKKLSHKEISSVELTQYYLERIKHHAALNAFISIDEQGALLKAQNADTLIAKGYNSPLMGIPMAHKDIFCTKQLTTTCGSKMLAQYRSPFDATIVEKLNTAGAVMLGKTNMDEFAMGSSNESSYFGAVLNPWDRTRSPGGSSGGSAAAVAAGLAAYATGSDTGGSIRQPAAFCGLTGLKPTYGLVSRYGMVAYASSLDQAGPIAKSAEDVAIILNAMAGFDPKDSNAIEQAPIDYTQALEKPLDKIRIGLPTGFLNQALPLAIQQNLDNTLAVFRSLGAEIVPIVLNTESLWLPCYYVIACAEASSNLSRYDGIRFGHRSVHANTLKELITHSRSEGFGAEVKRRILTGTHVLSSGYYDAYYLQALKIRRKIQDELCHALKNVDFLIGPSTPTSAFLLNEAALNPTLRYLSDIYTVAANLAGLPALSMPAGFDAHLPIGIQLIAKHLDEGRLLQLAHQFQRITDWHLHYPNLEGYS